MKMLFALAILITAVPSFAVPAPCQIDITICWPKPKPCTPTVVETYHFRQTQMSEPWTFLSNAGDHHDQQ